MKIKSVLKKNFLMNEISFIEKLCGILIEIRKSVCLDSSYWYNSQG